MSSAGFPSRRKKARVDVDMSVTSSALTVPVVTAVCGEPFAIEFAQSRCMSEPSSSDVDMDAFDGNLDYLRDYTGRFERLESQLREASTNWFGTVDSHKQAVIAKFDGLRRALDEAQRRVLSKIDEKAKETKKVIDNELESAEVYAGQFRACCDLCESAKMSGDRVKLQGANVAVEPLIELIDEEEIFLSDEGLDVDDLLPESMFPFETVEEMMDSFATSSCDVIECQGVKFEFGNVADVPVLSAEMFKRIQDQWRLQLATLNCAMFSTVKALLNWNSDNIDVAESSGILTYIRDLPLNDWSHEAESWLRIVGLRGPIPTSDHRRSWYSVCRKVIDVMNGFDDLDVALAGLCALKVSWNDCEPEIMPRVYEIEAMMKTVLECLVMHASNRAIWLHVCRFIQLRGRNSVTAKGLLRSGVMKHLIRGFSTVNDEVVALDLLSALTVFTSNDVLTEAKGRFDEDGGLAAIAQLVPTYSESTPVMASLCSVVCKFAVSDSHLNLSNTVFEHASVMDALVEFAVQKCHSSAIVVDVFGLLEKSVCAQNGRVSEMERFEFLVVHGGVRLISRLLQCMREDEDVLKSHLQRVCWLLCKLASSNNRAWIQQFFDTHCQEALLAILVAAETSDLLRCNIFDVLTGIVRLCDSDALIEVLIGSGRLETVLGCVSRHRGDCWPVCEDNGWRFLTALAEKPSYALRIVSSPEFIRTFDKELTTISSTERPHCCKQFTELVSTLAGRSIICQRIDACVQSKAEASTNVDVQRDVVKELKRCGVFDKLLEVAANERVKTVDSHCIGDALIDILTWEDDCAVIANAWPIVTASLRRPPSRDVFLFSSDPSSIPWSYTKLVFAAGRNISVDFAREVADELMMAKSDSWSGNVKASDSGAAVKGLRSYTLGLLLWFSPQLASADWMVACLQTLRSDIEEGLKVLQPSEVVHNLNGIVQLIPLPVPPSAGPTTRSKAKR